MRSQKNKYELLSFLWVMKKWTLVFGLVIVATSCFSQSDSVLAPYQKSPIFPPISLLLPDNTTFTKADLPKKKPVLLIIFSPTCEHCRHETEALIKNIDLFQKTEIIMATSMPYDSMMVFRERYKLADYKNIIVGQDTHFFLPSFYMISYLPFLAFYDRKERLISVFQGTMPIEKAAAELQKPAGAGK